MRSNNDKGAKLEVVLLPPATILGRIVDDHGVAQSDADISLLIGSSGFYSGGQLWSLDIRDDGRFIFKDVPVLQPATRPIQLCVSKRGFRMALTDMWKLKAGRTLDVGDVVIERAEGFEDVNLKWNRTLSGRVLNGNGAPVRGTRVVTFVGNGCIDDYTDFRGHYRLTGLPEGLGFTLEVEDIGQERYSSHEIKVGPDSGPVLDLRVPPRITRDSD